MAAAIILIPEMLSGPDRSERLEQPVAQERSETGLKTYSIDLNNPPGTNNAPTPIEERAPPPEKGPEQDSPASAAAAPSAERESNPEPARPSSSTPEPTQSVTRAPNATTASPVSEPVVEKPAQTRPVEPRRTPAPLASASNVPTSKGWAVQLGSFSSSATAERLASEFRAGGDNVFVMPVKSGASTLYRVRIGPMQDRAEAEDVLRRIRAKVSGAAIVAHP